MMMMINDDDEEEEESLTIMYKSCEALCIAVGFRT